MVPIKPLDSHNQLSSRSKFTIQSPGFPISSKKPRKAGKKAKAKQKDMNSDRNDPTEKAAPLLHHGSTPHLYQHVKPRYLDPSLKTSMVPPSPVSKKSILSSNLLAKEFTKQPQHAIVHGKKMSATKADKPAAEGIKPEDTDKERHRLEEDCESDPYAQAENKSTGSDNPTKTYLAHKGSISGVSLGAHYKKTSPGVLLLYYKSIGRYAERDKLKAAAQAIKSQKELQECTFRPATLHRSKSSKHIQRSSNQIGEPEPRRPKNSELDNSDEMAPRAPDRASLARTEDQRRSQPSFSGLPDNKDSDGPGNRSKSFKVISEKRKQELQAFYEQQVAWDADRKEKVARIREERLETEKASCTFTPSILESSFDGMDWKAIHEKIKGTYERQMQWLLEVNHDKEYLRQSIYDSVGKLPLLHFFRGDDSAAVHSDGAWRSFVKKEFQTLGSDSQIPLTLGGKDCLNSSSATGRANLTQIMDPETILRFEIQDAFKMVKSLDKLIATNNFKKSGVN